MSETEGLAIGLVIGAAVVVVGCIAGLIVAYWESGE